MGLSPLRPLPFGTSGGMRPNTPRSSSSQGPLTSISHLNDSHANGVSSSSGPSTSISHPGVSNTANNEDDQITDHLRQKFIDQKMKQQREAKAQAKIASQAKKSGPYDLEFGTGSAYRGSGSAGFERMLQKKVHKYHATLGNLSAEDQKLVRKVIGDKAKAKTTGSSFSVADRKQLKGKITQAWKEGKISQTDKNVIHKMIDGTKK